MSASDKLFLMVDEQHSYAQLVSGPDACTAVEMHYAMLDAWCSPSPDAEISEEFLLHLYEVPAHLAKEVSLRFEALDSDEIAGQVVVLAHEKRSVASVKVTYTAAGGAKASELPALPNLFNGLREG